MGSLNGHLIQTGLSLLTRPPEGLGVQAVGTPSYMPWILKYGGLQGRLEIGEGVVWGEGPLMTLPFPLVFLLPSTLARAFTKGKLGLKVEGVEEGGLIKRPALLRIDCWRTSNAV